MEKGLYSSLSENKQEGEKKGAKSGDSKVSPMESKILQPSRNVLDIKGKIAYGDSSQTWSNIRLKKEIIDEFPALREKRASFSYNLLFYRNYNELEKAIRKMRRQKTPLPLLMFMMKEATIKSEIK